MEAYSQESWEKTSDAHIARTIEKLRGKKQTNMAKVADMEIEFKQSERIALIDSAVELVKIFANRRPTIAGDTIFDIEQPLYKAALEFLQMQYELERPCVHIKTMEPPGKSVEPVVHMRAH